MVPCPFCGFKKPGVVEIKGRSEADTVRYAGHCSSCKSTGPKRKTRLQAEIAWDTRSYHAEAQRRKNCDECVRIAEGEMVAKLQARVAELEKFEASMRCPNCDNLRLEIGQLRRRVAELEAMLHDIIDSIPSTYDEEDPTVKRHAEALNVAWNSLKEVGHDG